MMKQLMTVFAMACMVFFAASAAVAADYVDVGDATSESGHNLQGWGPIEPANSGGTYGGIDDCRAIWYDTGDINNPDPNWATIDLDFGSGGGNICLAMHHLEGLADDSFEVYIGTTWVYAHADIISQQELWIWTIIPVTGYSGIQTVKLVATGTQWSGFSTYGQVCFDELLVDDCVVDATPDTWGSVKSLYR
jgi:hypothetical protein